MQPSEYLAVTAFSGAKRTILDPTSSLQSEIAELCSVSSYDLDWVSVRIKEDLSALVRTIEEGAHEALEDQAADTRGEKGGELYSEVKRSL